MPSAINGSVAKSIRCSASLYPFAATDHCLVYFLFGQHPSSRTCLLMIRYSRAHLRLVQGGGRPCSYSSDVQTLPRIRTPPREINSKFSECHTKQCFAINRNRNNKKKTHKRLGMATPCQRNAICAPYRSHGRRPTPSRSDMRTSEGGRSIRRISFERRGYRDCEATT